MNLFARGIEIFAVIHLVLMGASHILLHRAWAEFFMVLAQHGRAGVFVHGFLSLWFGSVVVAFHNVWTGLPVALTLFGWLLVLKAAHCFLLSDAALRSLKSVTLESSRRFVLPGIVYLLVAACIVAHLAE